MGTASRIIVRFVSQYAILSGTVCVSSSQAKTRASIAPTVTVATASYSINACAPARAPPRPVTRLHIHAKIAPARRDTISRSCAAQPVRVQWHVGKSFVFRKDLLCCLVLQYRRSSVGWCCHRATARLLLREYSKHISGR
jgi:hypothetical protein